MAKKYFALAGLLFILLAAANPVRAQTADTDYFSETGHNLSGEFLSFYRADPNAVTLYGFPITEQLTSRDGKTVQYFQRARFELDAAQPEGSRVLLTQLGRETYSLSNPLEIGNGFSCRFFSESGYSVCFDFLKFFDANGGEASFGLPISGFEYHESKVVQYFERARLEWQPWRLGGNQVIISDLGRAYFEKLGEDPALLASVSPVNNAPRVVTKLLVRAFVWKAVTLSTDKQSFYIIVQDQNLQAVPGAACSALVEWPFGAQDSTSLISDKNGLGIYSLEFFNQPSGRMVNVNIECSYNALSGKTSTSFRIWY